MFLEYAVIIIVTIGIVLGIIFGKYKLIKKENKIQSQSKPLCDNKKDVDEFIIKETKERINQELQNVSADELKANVVAAISVVFAILVLSEFLRIYEKITEDDIWVSLILVSISIIVLFVSFFKWNYSTYPSKKPILVMAAKRDE